MDLQQFSSAELQAKAVELGLIPDGGFLANRDRSRVAAAIIEERRAVNRPDKAGAEPQLAKSITVQPGGAILVDGEPLPWLVAKQPMEIGLNPDGVSTVRLTLLAESVQVLKPKPDTNSTESE